MKLQAVFVGCVCLVAFLVPAGAEAQGVPGADRPETNTDRLERRVLDSLTADQRNAFLAGADAASLFLVPGLSLEAFIDRVDKGLDYGVARSTFAPSDRMGPSGDYYLTASLGQTGVGAPSSGGNFLLRGGFWSTGASNGEVFSSGFESGDLSDWSSAVGN